MRNDYSFPLQENHSLLGSSILPPFPEELEKAAFAMGCFWGAERLFWQKDGVWTTAVGYSGGKTPYPTYEEVCSGETEHAEAVLVLFDPNVIKYQELLKTFFEEHNPTEGMRQGNDIGSQYRSIIFTNSEEQKTLAEETLRLYDKELKENGFPPITTTIEPLPDFYYAEDYHQQYLGKNPNGYCGLQGTGVECKS